LVAARRNHLARQARHNSTEQASRGHFHFRGQLVVQGARRKPVAPAGAFVMAQREGQGLQIAVIVFAMLTIILAITTYVFYAQSQTNYKDLQAKTKALDDKQNENNKLLGRVTAMNYVLGLKSTTMQDVDLAKSRAGDDPDMKEILDNFTSDMTLVGGEQVAGGTASYRTFVSSLLAALNKKNASIADANAQTRKAQEDKDAAEKAALARAQTAEASAKKAEETYTTESQKFTADRATTDEEKGKLATQLTTFSAKATADLKKIQDERDALTKASATQQGTIKTLGERLEEYKKEEASLFERPDGHIRFVNQRLQMVSIDVGRVDGLLRQTTFSVFDHNENGISNAKPKARIEVVSLDDHMSEARILEDTPANPIISGDIIFTPAWSPGQRVHFALAMKMDINKDRVDDYEMVKNIILMNGGVIDAELRADGTRVGDITVNTRYFVQGERPSEATSQKVLDQFKEFDKERERSGVEKIPVEKLLSLMGWKAEERTLELAGNRAGGDFRKRTPGKTQPTNGATPAPSAADAPMTPAAPAAADPFATPAAPAPAAADPFATPPAGKAAPATEADPFATPR
jgi:hypothetical protein